MNNIEYQGIPYFDDAEIKRYRRLKRKKARRGVKYYQLSKAAMVLIEKAEQEAETKALANYQKIRDERKYKENLNMLKRNKIYFSR